MKIEASLEKRFCAKLRSHGCFVYKNNAGPGVPKGMPDDTVLMPGGGWAVLEFKASEKAPYQVLQKEQLKRLDDMWYSATVYPENEEEIMAEILAML
jgi:Holliday junction resolvase